MAKPRKTPNQPATVATAAELARWCGVSTRTVATWKTMAGFPIETDGSFAPFKVAQWHALRLVAPEQTDPDMAGPTTPAIEEYRMERTLIVRMERKKLEQLLIPVEFVRESYSIVAGHLRRLGERFNIGVSDPAGMLANTIQDIERAGLQWLDENTGGSKC